MGHKLKNNCVTCGVVLNEDNRFTFLKGKTTVRRNECVDCRTEKLKQWGKNRKRRFMKNYERKNDDDLLEMARRYNREHPFLPHLAESLVVALEYYKY